MASISKDASGNRTIQFVGKDGKRRSIRLGKVPQEFAKTIKHHVEKLNAATILEVALDADSARWISKLDDSLRDRLARVGLVDAAKAPEKPVIATLKGFLDDYIARRCDVKATTVLTYNQARRHLIDYFGPDKGLAEINPGDADTWRLQLVSKGYAENTVRRWCGRAKQFFRSAVRHRLIERSPFDDMKGTTVRANRLRDYFVTRDEAQQVLDACPDNEWRLLFALCRFGGLRCPSEPLALSWHDVDWERGRLHITCVKTEHVEGKESRIIPLFPEIRLYLEAAFDKAEPGAEHVITRYRDRNCNLRTQLNRIIKRAGLTPWPKLFHNLRASRETELASSYPLHVVCEWIGNTAAVAQAHYLRVRETDFTQALQNPVQQPGETTRNETQPKIAFELQTQAMPKVASPCEPMQFRTVARAGLEPAREFPPSGF